MSIGKIKESRGVGTAPASHNQLGGWLHHPLKASDRQAQFLTTRFRLSRSLARETARLCFGEAVND